MFSCKYFTKNETNGIEVEIKISGTSFEIFFIHEDRSILIPFALLQQNPYQNHDFCILKFNTDPVSSVEIRSKQFLNSIPLAFRAAGLPSPLKKKSYALLYLFLFSLIILFGSLVALYFVGMPWLAKKVCSKIPVEQEVKFGAQMYASITSQSKVDKAKSNQLNLFFKQLKINSEYPIKITVLDEDVMNAYATAGGYIYVYSGMLNKMQTKEELAALLAHEYSHIELKHTLQSMIENMGSYTLLSILFGDVSTIIINNINELKSLHFSRQLEKEADLNGLILVTQSHLSAQGFVDLFNLLKSENNSSVSELVSSHPDLDSRINYIINNPLYKNTITFQNTSADSVWIAIKK